MLMNLFIPVHKCHVNTRRSFSNRYIFFLIQIRTLQYTTVKNAKSCAHNFKLFSAHFFQLLCYDVPQFRETPKFYSMHYSYVVITLFSTGLHKSVFSTYSFGKLGLRLSVFFVI